MQFEDRFGYKGFVSVVSPDWSFLRMSLAHWAYHSRHRYLLSDSCSRLWPHKASDHFHQSRESVSKHRIGHKLSESLICVSRVWIRGIRPKHSQIWKFLQAENTKTECWVITKILMTSCGQHSMRIKFGSGPVKDTTSSLYSPFIPIISPYGILSRSH